VFRPSLPSTTSRQREIGRNLALDLVAAVSVGVTVALVSTLLPTIARRGGLEPIGLAALAAAPFLANLLGVFAGRIGPRSPRQFALLRGAGAASLLVLAFVNAAPVMIAVAFVFWLSNSLGSPFHLRLWGAMYPARVRGRVVGFIGSGRAAAGAIAALAGGLIADRVGGEQAVALAGLVGVVCALAYAGFRAPNAARPVSFSARDSIRALRERPILSRVALAQGFYGGGLIAVAVLWIAAVAAGAGSASIDVGIASIVSDHTTLASRSAAMAGWNAITGARGIVAAFTMAVLLEAGIVNVTIGLLLCAGISAVGALLFATTITPAVLEEDTPTVSALTSPAVGQPRSAA
jgi:hypothetical protein